MTNCLSRRAIAYVLLTTTSLSIPTIAQAATPAPKFTTIDDHGVDLVTGLPFMSLEEGGIGSGPGRISVQRIWAEGAGWVDNWSGGLYKVGTKWFVQFGGISDTFTQSGSTYTSDKSDGATLIVDGSGFFIYTSRDGTQVKFDQEHNSDSTVTSSSNNCPGADPATCQVPLTITAPTGLKFTINWTRARLCLNVPDPCTEVYFYRRLNTVTSSAGYKLTAAYATNNAGTGTVPPADWFKRTGITFDNNANHPSTLPAIAYAYPNATTITVTDPASRTWTFTMDGSDILTGIKRPGSASDNISYTYSSGQVNSATKDGVADTYSYFTNPLSGAHVTTRTDPLGGQVVVTTSTDRPSTYKDELNRTTGYTYDANSRLTKITAPEGNYVQLTYDTRGNVTQSKAVSKTPGTPADIVTSASFESTCTTQVKCNKPNTTTDAKGNVTNYTYDTTHGGLTSIKLPAPSIGADRPETRISYTQVNSAQGDLVYMPTGSSACASGVAPACVGTANETKASASYNSNLLPTTVSRGDGTGVLTAITSLAFDPRGNLLTVDGPLLGTADTTAFKYDAADQQIGVISPDPDGADSLPNRAIRLTYRSDGQVSKQDLGTTVGQSDSAFNAMSVAQTVDVTFDTNSRPVTSKLSGNVSGTMTAQALTQTSYDSLGRVDCSAVRMNIALYGSLPASACTLGTQGSYGPDRISQLVYDAADEVTQLKVAVGTSDAATERTLTYSNNGMLATLKDGENNLTTYTYDGFDRPSQTQYPNTTKGSGTSNASDYEQLSYDANSNVTSRRLRDDNSVSFTYDNLDRLTVQGPPNPEPSSTFGYDNLGRLTSAAKAAFGISLSFTYDALSRKLTETGPEGTATSEWDLAGRRAKLTYPGTGLYVNTDYLVTGEVTVIRENGATSGVGVLASYGYDNLGNRILVTFGNGASQAYTYDAVARLTSLTNNLSGTSNDLTIDNIGYNPASQMTGAARSNNAYAFTGYANGSTATTTNGLNQQTAVGGSSASWDSRGNLTTDPTTSKSYTYWPSSDQLWTSSSPFTAMSYDPLDRLAIIDSTTDTKFAYDGMETLAEYDGSDVLQKRYVFGPGMDEPIVRYDGSGTSNRSFLGSDERGSIISATDSSGTLLGINTYDEYGRPGASNTGRFQYTGQRWLSEAGLYDYKARNYAPHLGIFGQTDPIGMADSANLYAYVVNDPVNLVDPLGLLLMCSVADHPFSPCPWQPTYGGGGGGGGAGGNLSRVFPRPAKFIRQSEDQFTCADALREPGAIQVTALSGGVVGAIGWTGAIGTWTNLKTGSHGRFSTFGFAAGLSGGASGGGQRWSSLSSFAGPSDSFTVAVAFNFGPFSIGGEYTKGWNDSGSGSGGGVSVSSSGLPRVALQGASTETELTQCLPGPRRL